MKFISPQDAVGKEWIDFSSAKSYMSCPRQYWWQYIQNLTTVGEKAALVNGEAAHQTKATFYELKKEGVLPLDDIIRISLKPGLEIMSRISGEDPVRNKSVFIDTMENYMRKWWASDRSKTILIEAAGAVDMGDFLFAFRVDRLREDEHGLLIEETKTTTIVGTKWDRRGNPNMQIDGYVVGIESLTDMKIDGGILDVIPFHKDASKRKDPFRVYAKRGEVEKENWYHDICDIWDEIQRSKERNFFRRNTETCIPLLGFECPYTLLCEMYPNPHILNELPVPGEYKVEKWEPFEGLNV